MHNDIRRLANSNCLGTGKSFATLGGQDTPPRNAAQFKYEKTTRAITVTVRPFYLDEQSSPDEEHYVWAYRVNIENGSDDTVKLINRHWRITDKLGRLQEVKGPGVVGEQPVLKPGESFEYTSGTPLPTPSGIMVGTYEMESNRGERFDVEIPAFSLDSPYDSARVN